LPLIVGSNFWQRYSSFYEAMKELQTLAIFLCVKGNKVLLSSFTCEKKFGEETYQK